jgi:hypothetical protein
VTLAGCTATATFGGDTNHLGSNDSKSITITQASSATVVTFEAGPYVYRATAFTATALVTGVGGLSQSVPVVYSGDCTSVTLAGCMATATFGGDTNHNGSSDSKSITITQASSATAVTFEAGPYVYRGTPFTATAAATGVGLSTSVAVVYSGDCTNVTVANGCTASATYAGDVNHTGSVDSKSITISPATTNSAIVAPTLTNNTTLTITVNVGSGSLTPGGDVDLTLNSGPSSPILTLGTKPLTGGSATFVVPGLTDGSYLLSATYGPNTTNFLTSSATWTTVIDTMAPNTVINTGPAGLTTATTAVFTYQGSDGGAADTFRCSLDGGPFVDCTLATAMPGIYTTTYPGLAAGPHNFRVQATDGAGNTDSSPAIRSWIIGSVTSDLATVDETFKHFDGFDVVFGKGTGTALKITSTNPGTFHHQLFITNNTGVNLNTPNGQTAGTSAIIEVPGMPASCGPNITCSAQVGSLGNPAFKVRGHTAAHVWPDNHEEQLAMTVQYMTLAGYQANGNSCAETVSSSYSSTMPADGAPKCIKVSGFALPDKHKARIRTNFEFRPKGTDMWDPNSKQYFFAGFPFQSATTVSYGGASQTSIDTAGIVGAGNKMTAVGGFVFNTAATPGTGMTVRLFNNPAQVSACGSSTNVVAQDAVDSTGFYFIWRTGTDSDSMGTTNLLPSGVQYAVQLCNGGTPLGPIKTTDSKLHDKEFVQVDFDDLNF